MEKSGRKRSSQWEGKDPPLHQGYKRDLEERTPQAIKKKSTSGDALAFRGPYGREGRGPSSRRRGKELIRPAVGNITSKNAETL